MSRLDNLYTNYRQYCREIASKRKGSLTYILLFEDGSGRVETKQLLATVDHPFRVETEEILRFNTPGDGARKLKELVDAGTKALSESD